MHITSYLPEFKIMLAVECRGFLQARAITGKSLAKEEI